MSSTVKPLGRYIALTPAHEKKIDELKERVETSYHPLPQCLVAVAERTQPGAATQHNWERQNLYRFLVSCQWNVDKAFAMVQRVIAYRTEHRIDETNPFPTTFSVRGWDEDKLSAFVGAPPREKNARTDRICDAVKSAFSSSVHYWDRHGLPVVYMMIGTVDEPALIKKMKQLANIGESPSDTFWEYTRHTLCVCEQLCVYQQHLYENGELPEVDASEGLIASVTIVADCDGLNYKMLWKPALDLFMGNVSRVLQLYPDCVHRIMVVNCPAMILFAYNIVKGIMDENIQRKVFFYNTQETFSALEQVIDKRYIPIFLGGECECANNCVGSFDAKSGKRVENATAGEDAGDVETEDITLGAGKKYERAFDMLKGEEVAWDFAVLGEADIFFSLYFVPSTDDTTGAASCDSSGKKAFCAKKHNDFLVNKDRFTAGTDVYTAEAPGTLYMVWENPHTWFHKVKVQMKIYKGTAAYTQIGMPS